MKDLISSVRVETGQRHDRVTVWNRGGSAGVLTVDAGDGNAVARRLGDAQDGERIEGWAFPDEDDGDDFRMLWTNKFDERHMVRATLILHTEEPEK